MTAARKIDPDECRYACAGKPAVHKGQRVQHQAVGQSRVAVEAMCSVARRRHKGYGCVVVGGGR